MDTITAQVLNNLTEKIETGITAAASKLQVGAERVYPLMVQKIWWKGLTECLSFIPALLVMGVFIFCYKRAKWNCGFYNNEPNVEGFASVIFFALSIVAVVIAFYIMPEGIMKIANAKMYAIEAIIKMVKPN